MKRTVPAPWISPILGSPMVMVREESIAGIDVAGQGKTHAFFAYHEGFGSNLLIPGMDEYFHRLVFGRGSPIGLSSFDAEYSARRMDG